MGGSVRVLGVRYGCSDVLLKARERVAKGRVWRDIADEACSVDVKIERSKGGENEWKFRMIGRKREK